MKPLRSALIADAVLIVIFALVVILSYKQVQADKEIVRNEFLAAMADNYDKVFAYKDSQEYGLIDYEYDIIKVTRNDSPVAGVYSDGGYAVHIELRCSSSYALNSTQKSLLAFAVEHCIPDTYGKDFGTTMGQKVGIHQHCNTFLIDRKIYSSDRMVYTYVNGELVHKPTNVVPEGTLFFYQIKQIIWTVLFCLLLIAIPGITVLKLRHMERKAMTDAVIAQKQREVNLTNFYDECIKNGIYSCKNAKEVQKATLIAQKMDLPFSDISALYDEAKQHQVRQEQQKAKEALEQEQKEEQQKYDSLTRYAGYTGREKRIAMLSDEHSKYAETSRALSDWAYIVSSSSQFKEKEADWGTVGGLASAIGGPGAGLAAALEEQARVERENAQIREQNRRNREYFAPVINQSIDSSAEYRVRAKRVEEEIEAAKTKLIANDTLADCLKRICIESAKVDVSRTGTCTVTATVSVKPFMIFGDVPAVIDGVIIAGIFDHDKLIGKAQMVLPTYGISGSAQLTGMALFCGHQGVSYDLKFTSENLWAMEK